MVLRTLKTAFVAGLTTLRQVSKLGVPVAAILVSFACTMDQPLRPEVQALSASTESETNCADEIDNDGDGAIDREDSDCGPFILCFIDFDGDEWGGQQTESALIDIGCPTGTVNVSHMGDCDDSADGFLVNPGRPEICGNGLDDDCVGGIDDGCESAIDPEDSSTECHDGVDNDDDGLEDNLDPDCGIRIDNCSPDVDGDGYGDDNIAHVRYGECDGDEIDNNRDCDDDYRSIHPGATEVCNDLDDDCDGLTDEGGICVTETCYDDDDGDGYGDENDAGTDRASCLAGEVTNNEDCNDSQPAIRPGATEVVNGFDDDCDRLTDEGSTICYPDDDGDGYGDDSATGVSRMTCRTNEVTNDNDCDDSDSGIHSGCGTLVTCYPDDDNDGYGDDQAAGIDRTSCRTDEVTNDNDCDDGDSGIHSGCGVVSPDSGTIEFCWNGSGIDDVDIQRMQLVVFEEGTDQSAESVIQTSGLATSNDCIETTQVFAVGDVACVNVTFTHNDPGVPVYQGDEWFLAACDGLPCDPIVMGIPSINGQRPALNEVYTDTYRSSGSRLSYTTVSEDGTPTAGQWFWATNWNGTGVDLCVTMTDVLF